MQYFESCGLSLLPPEMSSAATPGALEPPRELDDLVLRVAAFGELARGEPHDQREIGQLVLQPRDRLHEEPRAIVERAAVAVGALVDARREELLEEIAVARVDLDARRSPPA